MKKLMTMVVAMMFILAGCGTKASNDTFLTQEFDYFYFDTPINIKVYYNDTDKFNFDKMDTDLDQMLNKIEQQFSPNITTSEISTLNKDGKMDVDDEFLKVLTTSIDYCKSTDGLYDPSAGPLIDLWSINNNDYLPTQEEIDKLLPKVDCNNIGINGNTVTLGEGMKIDLGSIVKGYAADVLQTYLMDQGVTSALINLGGNIQTVGTKPDGSSFVIGVQTPEVESLYTTNVLTFDANDESVVTSGINQRYFIQDGVIYHHIINANVGAPEQNNLASVTIINHSGIDADALSTTCFLLGLDSGMDLINSLDDTEAIFITRDKKVYFSNPDMTYDLVNKDYTVEDYVKS